MTVLSVPVGDQINSRHRCARQAALGGDTRVEVYILSTVTMDYSYIIKHMQ